jgi:hypothetical protein
MFFFGWRTSPFPLLQRKYIIQEYISGERKDQQETLQKLSLHTPASGEHQKEQHSVQK